MEPLVDFPDWIRTVIAAISAVIIGLGVHTLVFFVWGKFNAKYHGAVSAALLAAAHRPTRFIFPLFLTLVFYPMIALPKGLQQGFAYLIAVGLIGSLAWLAIRLLEALVDLGSLRLRVDQPDNLAARSVLTEIQLMRRVAVIAIVTIAAAWVLSLFPAVQGLGTTLFASAGVAGIIIGIAARPTLSNLIAGIQIAITKTIRLYDAVIVEGEWGWVEEITTTYVVVRIWDWRRLVLPISYFVEKPFENWTRPTANLLGEVFIYADYSLPVDPLREEFLRILQASPLWDGRSHVLQVTDATERTIQIRALMSAPNSQQAFDLRCYVREKLIQFIQHHYPQSLPRVRTQLEQGEVPPAPTR